MILKAGESVGVMNGRMLLSVEETPDNGEGTTVLTARFIDGPHIVKVEYKTDDFWQKKKAFDHIETVIHQMGESLLNVMLYGSTSHTQHLRAHCKTPVSNKKHYLTDELDKTNKY